MQSGKRILVTGGAGFLGSYVCERLIARGDEVLCVDNYLTGDISNVEKLFECPKFTMISHDICDPIKIDGAVDEIYNLACPASPPKYQIDPIYTVKINVFGSLNMLKLAEQKNAKILQASTSEVYGDPSISPQKEEYWGNVNPIGVRACYDEGKRCAETLFFEFQRQKNVNIKVVRIFNTYGPQMSPNDGRVVSNFIMQALKGDDISIYGNGSQTRSFCYRDDLVRGLLLMMSSEDTIEHPINLGNPEEFSISELARIILEITKSSSEIKFYPLPQDDPIQRRPDISRAKTELSWEPTISLYDGLQKTISYFKQIMQNS